MATTHSINNVSQTVIQAYKYQNLRIKIMKLNKTIWFNKKCLELEIIPNYIPIKNKYKTKSAKKSTWQSQMLWIKNEIKSAYIKKDEINRILYKLHLNLSNILHQLEWKSFTDNIYNKVKNMAISKQETLEKKIKELQFKYKGKEKATINKERITFYQKVDNRTHVNFTQNEIKLLEKGLKHNCENKHTTKDIKQLIVDAEIACDKLPIENRNVVKTIIMNKTEKIIKKEKTSNVLFKNQKSALKSLKQKIKHDNLIVTKADKGNTTVIMNKSEYIEKTNNFIENNNIKEITKDPIKKFQSEIKGNIKTITHILENREKYKMINMNPQTPTLRSLPKIHKEDCNIRPIINFKNAPSYNASKFLNNIISNEVHIKNNKTIRNSIELTTKLQEVEINDDTRLVSFDVSNMYTSIPKKESLILINELLKENGNEHETKEIMKLLETVLNQNVFTFNSKIYQQEEGLAMGSPLSGLIANIFMNNLENKFLAEEGTKGIKYWGRFVDDVCCIYDSTLTTDTEILNKLNELHPNIKFTKETEINKKLNYLDITIHRQTNCLKFTIYRKPTQTTQIIHNSSNHPHSHKMAALHSFVHRATSLPLDAEHYKNEIAIIKQIAIENEYPPTIIDKIITKQSKNKTKENENENQNIKYATFNFINKNSYNITNILKKYGIKIAFRTNNTLQRKLHNNDINFNNKINNSGIYKLTCQFPDCQASYLGQSGRNFITRYKEHLNAFKYNKFSAFSQHIVENNHTFTGIEKDLEIMHFEKKGKKLDILEAIEIYIDKKKNPNNLNEHTWLRESPLFMLLDNK